MGGGATSRQKRTESQIEKKESSAFIIFQIAERRRWEAEVMPACLHLLFSIPNLQLWLSASELKEINYMQCPAPSR